MMPRIIAITSCKIAKTRHSHRLFENQRVVGRPLGYLSAAIASGVRKSSCRLAPPGRRGARPFTRDSHFPLVGVHFRPRVFCLWVPKRQTNGEFKRAIDTGWLRQTLWSSLN